MCGRTTFVILRSPAAQKNAQGAVLTWKGGRTVVMLPPAIAPFRRERKPGSIKPPGPSTSACRSIYNSIRHALVLIPPGEFNMGSAEAEVAQTAGRSQSLESAGLVHRATARRGPRHHVRITKPFYLGLCEVTQAEYERVVGSNPSNFKDDPTRPVEMVNWDNASAFCRKLSERPRSRRSRLGIGSRPRPSGSPLAGPGRPRDGIRVTMRRH